jgi:hypothetical protein
MKVSFEMIDSDQHKSLLGNVVSSTGYYEIKPEKDGCRVIYFQSGEIEGAFQRNIFSVSLESETTKFLLRLKKYVEGKCH